MISATLNVYGRKVTNGAIKSWSLENESLSYGSNEDTVWKTFSWLYAILVF